MPQLSHDSNPCIRLLRWDLECCLDTGPLFFPDVPRWTDALTWHVMYLPKWHVSWRDLRESCLWASWAQAVAGPILRDPAPLLTPRGIGRKKDPQDL